MCFLFVSSAYKSGFDLRRTSSKMQVMELTSATISWDASPDRPAGCTLSYGRFQRGLRELFVADRTEAAWYVRSALRTVSFAHPSQVSHQGVFHSRPHRRPSGWCGSGHGSRRRAGGCRRTAVTHPGLCRLGSHWEVAGFRLDVSISSSGIGDRRAEAD